MVVSMLKKILLLFSFLIPFMVNAHIVHFGKFINPDTGQVIWFAGDCHKSEKSQNQINNKQFKQLLALARQEHATVLVEDNHLCHHEMIKELIAKNPEYLHNFDEYDQVLAKRDTKTLKKTKNSAKKTSVLWLSSILFRNSGIKIKNIEWRYTPACFDSITPAQFFKAEENIIHILSDREHTSNIGQLIQTSLENYHTQRKETYERWFNELEAFDHSTLKETLEKTSFLEFSNQGKEKILYAIYHSMLFNLNLLHEIDQLKDRKSILIMAGSLHTKQIALWLKEFNFQPLIEEYNFPKGIDSEPDAINLFKDMLVNEPNITLKVLKTKYPQGAEKQLIKAISGKEVPSGGLPLDVGIVVNNVGTALAVAEVIKRGLPLIKRVVTVTGDGVVEPSNLEVKIGTPFQEIIDQCGGFKDSPAKVIAGGPLMGIAQYTTEVPVIKGTSGILVFREDKLKPEEPQPCIKCARCVDVCPMFLLPLHLGTYAEKGLWERCEEFDTLDCQECGCCAYSCPAKRPLVQAIKLAKAEILAKKRINK